MLAYIIQRAVVQKPLRETCFHRKAAPWEFFPVGAGKTPLQAVCKR